MAFNGMTNSSWLIKVCSGKILSNKDRDFMADLVSEEARSVCKSYYFILHAIIEDKNYSEIFIEGSETALNNLLSVLEDNLPRMTIKRVPRH